MCPVIRIDEEVFRKLQELAEPFVDSPNTVLRKFFKLKKRSTETKPPSKPKLKEKPQMNKLPENLKPKVTYSYSRLCFKARLIEPLNDDDAFQVETTNDGTFRFTKADFYRTFPKLINTTSYKEDGIYHYRKVPQKALSFKIN